MGQARNWTQEEIEYLQDNWGSLSIKKIAQALGRTVDGIIVKKNRLGLGRFLDNGDYVTLNQLLATLHGCKGAHASRCVYMSKGLPVRTKRVGNNSFKIITLDDFWKWAEEHKRHIDFSKLEENALGKEPDWAKKKRKIDFICRVNTDPWTPLEDQKLFRMVNQYKYSYTDIANELHRTEGAVKRRLITLNYKGRPIKAENRTWTKQEVVELVFYFEEGYSFEWIGSRLSRSALCCRGKMERINNPEYFKRVNRRAREEKTG